MRATSAVTGDTLTSTLMLQVTAESRTCADCDIHIIWRLLVLVAILAGSIFANGIVFAVFRRKPSLLTISNRFVLNLSTCNMLLTAWVVPMSLSSLLTGGWPLRQAGCTVSAVVTMLLLTASTFSVLLISLDRYVAIVRPLHYPTLMTSRAANVWLGAVWVTSMLLALPPAFNIGHVTYDEASFTCNMLWTARDVTDRSYVFFVCTACFVLPFLFMLFIYLCVFCSAVRSSSRLRRNSSPHPFYALHTVLPSGLVALASLPVSTADGQLANVRRLSSSLSLFNSGSQLSRRRSVASVRGLLTQYRDDLHAAKTALLVLSTFALCWLPAFALVTRVQSTATAASHEVLQWQGQGEEDSVVPRWSRFVVVYLAQLSSVINPLVYVFHSRPLLSQCRRLLTCVHSPVTARRSSRASVVIREVDDRPSPPSLPLRLHHTVNVPTSLPLMHHATSMAEHSGVLDLHLQSTSSLTNDTSSPTRGVTFHIGTDEDSEDAVTPPLK